MKINQSKTLRKHLQIGRLEAERAGNVGITADIVFLSLFRDATSHAGQILRKLLKDWEIYQIRVRIEREAAKTLAKGEPSADAQAVAERIDLGVEAVGVQYGGEKCKMVNTGHFLMWLVSCKDIISSRVLELYGVSVEKIWEYVGQMPVDENYYREMNILEQFAQSGVDEYSSHREHDHNDVGYDDGGGTAVKTKHKTRTELEKFGVNLTRAAAEGRIDPVIGREKEIERLIQILGRRKKNNPILVGEAGVGKTAVVEGLALRMLGDDLPRSLRGKQVFSLDIASLVAGTKFRGQFEERIKTLIDELTTNKEIILFIDEIHTIVGAGSTQGSLDTANILKPALARGELQCIGATTLDEFRENIEKDAALERRFQKVMIEPSSKEDTLLILNNIKTYYEKHHGVRYTDEALKAAVELADRYLSDRFFPDKAIDVMDEAGSKARQFEVKEPAMLRGTEKLLDKILREKEEAAAAMDFDLAGQLRVKAVAIAEKLKEARVDWQREVSMNPFVIGVEHIEEVITMMTGIPVEKVSSDEKKRLSNLGGYLSSRVIGQSEAVSKVVKSIQRSRAGLKDPNKPIGVFMFVGPTGVGKTHLTKELAKWMFDRHDALIRIDMSEYSEKHNVSRLIGSPPGYVGYNEGGQLTEAVRRQPYAVVLFDEIEKAHPDVFNVMLQIFDDGHLTDGNDRKVDFRNTIIIMTSNVGSKRVAKRPKVVGYNTSNKDNMIETSINADYRKALEDTFAPEFINRIDDIVVFNTLSLDDVQKIVELELKYLYERAEALGYKIKVTHCARKRLAAMGYESRYGVRSLKRTILEAVEEPLAELIIGGKLEAGDTVRVECRGKSVEVLRKAS